MELLNEEEFELYIKTNYECIVELKNEDIKTEMSGQCDVCQQHAFLKVHSRTFNSTYYSRSEIYPQLVNFLVECPNCRRLSFLLTVQFAQFTPTGTKDEYGEDDFNTTYQFYKLCRIPTIEENFANKDIPDEYKSLKETIIEASFCLSHNRNIAAAILFRRAIQILAKDILGAIGKTLYLQLEWLKNNKNKLAIDLSAVFHDNAKIVKDIGNQGAHPDDDISLQIFTKDDANGLHDLFVSIIHEVFIKPEKMKAIQEELRKSRKLL
jgi:hypothetical protein